ncbi:MAG: hypothetical protein O3A53_02235 [Acidobacteria bacterium]|nr:hypothetical protein [Acidobacteriota bacterium]MDA1233600.1 hypothetical protein [Acidobacteriota bacterium]
MLRIRISILALSLSLFGVAACDNPDTTSEALDKTFNSAVENVETVADDTANALGTAAEDLGEFVEDAAEEVGRVIDDSARKTSNAK